MQITFRILAAFVFVLTAVSIIPGQALAAEKTPPTSSITDPADGAALNGGSYLITGTADDGTGSGVQSVEVSTDGGTNWSFANYTSGTWSYNWIYAANGNYAIQSRATDNASNVETPGPGITVTVDNTPPTSAITDPSDGATLTGTSYTITGTVFDNISGAGVSTVEVSTDGGTNWSFANYTSGSWSYDWTYPASGGYTIQSRGTDNISNIETPGPGVTVTAQITYLLSAETNPPGTATLAFNPSHTGNIYNEDETVWISAVPNAGYMFNNWTGDISGTDNPVAILMDSSKSVIANLSFQLAEKQWIKLLGITSSVTDVVVSPNYSNDQTIFAAVAGTGVYVSRDAGKNWTLVNNRTEVWELDISPNFIADSKIFASCGYDGLLASTDGGSNWIHVPTTCSDTFSVGISPDFSNDNTLFTGNGCRRVSRSINGGTSFISFEPSGFLGNTTEVAVPPRYNPSQIVYAINANKFYMSNNGGLSFSELSASIGIGIDTEIWISPSYSIDQIMFCNTVSGIYKSIYGGGWFRVLDASDPTLALSADYTSDHTAYAGMPGIVKKTVDGGTNWTDLDPIGLAGSTVESLDVTEDGNTIFAGTNNGVYVYMDTLSPSSGVTDPPNAAILSGTSYTISGTAIDYSGTGIQSVEISTDGGTNWYAATDTSGDGSWSAWSYDWTLPASGNSNYSILSRATDNASNVGSPGGVTVTVDNDPPSTTAAPGGGSYNNRIFVTLTTDKPGDIYYTMDGSEPTTASAVYTGPLLMGAGVDYPNTGVVDLKYFAVDGYSHSETVKTQRYIITPPVWTSLSGTSVIDEGYGATTDVSGNTYVTGETYGDLDGETSAGANDMFVTKYDSIGTRLWTRQLGTVSYDAGYRVTTDGGGNVYVTGETYGDLDGETNAGVYDMFVTKYDQDGIKQWTRQLGTTTNDIGNDVATDNSGYVYVAGLTSGAIDGQASAGSSDMFVTKYQPNGVKQWTRQLGTAGYDNGRGVATDGSGYFYVTGYTAGAMDGQSSAGGYDMFVTKYDQDGVRQWTRQLGTTGDDLGLCVATDGSGYVYVAGYTAGAIDGQTSAGGDDMFVTKYDDSGTRQWTRQLGTAGNDHGYGVVTDSGGNVYVTGKTADALDGRPSAGKSDIFVVKYDSNGVKQGTVLFGGSENDEGHGVTTDSSGNVYLSGFTLGNLDGQPTAGGYDIFIIRMLQDDITTAPPLSSITDPADGMTLSGVSYTITGGATDYSGTGISTVEVSTDGGTNWSFANYTSGSWSYDWTYPASGGFTVQSRATDNASNVETPGPGITVTVDNIAPVSSIVAPSDGATLAGTSYTITGTVFDNISGTGVSTVEVSTSGGNSWTFANYSSGTWSYDWPLPEDGNYNILSRATDNASNVETPGAGVTVTVDNTAPATTATPSGASYSARMWVTLASNDPAATIYYTTDGSTPTTSSAVYSGPVLIGAGVNYPDTAAIELKYFAEDSAGNSEAVRTDTYDITPPPWTRQYGTDVCDFAQGVFTDAAGNIYVAGVTEGDLDGNTSTGSEDMFLVKFDPFGDKQWTRQFGTSGNDGADGVSADPAGNIYVAGHTYSDIGDFNTNAGGYDMFVTKYDTSGTRQWTRQLGSASYDYGQAVSTDASGNVYVAGHAGGDIDGETNAGGEDGLLVKYDSSGVKQWSRLLGTAGYDSASGVSTDASGDVYVAGYVGDDLDGYTNSGGYDMFLAKYDSGGVKLWSRLLGTSGYDSAYGISTDASGNVYVAGYTDGAIDGQTSAGDYDLFVTKYDTDGVKQWTRQLGSASYEFAYGISTDAFGGIYVAGYTGGALDGNTYAGGEDIFVVKYDTDGVKQWTRQIGTAGYDFAYGVSVGPSGSVYISGLSSAGLDGNADTDEGYDDYYVMKILDAPPDTTPPSSAITAPTNGSTLTGTSYTITGTASDAGSGVSTVEVSTDGGSNWSFANYTSDTWSYDWPLPEDGNYNILSRATDNASNVETPGAGVTVTVDNTAPATTATPAGASYNVRMRVTLESDDPAATIYYTTDGSTPTTSSAVYSGTILVGAGVDYPDSANIDLKFFAKDTTGNEEAVVTELYSITPPPWTRQLGTTSNDAGYEVATDDNGNIYVTGFTGWDLDGQTGGNGYNAFLTKYFASGAKVWTRLIGGTGHDYSIDVATDTDGNAYICGWADDINSPPSTGLADILIAKYDGDGVNQWTRQFGSTDDDYGQGITTDGSGNVYVCGWTAGDIDGQSSAGDFDIFVTKYDNSGVKQWTRQLGTSYFDGGVGITTVGSANVYVTGLTYGALDGEPSAGDSDIFITKYDSGGVKLWTRQLGSSGKDCGQDIASDASGNIYVTGFTDGALDGQSNSGYSDIFVTKYDGNGVKLWTRQSGTAFDETAFSVTTDIDGYIYISGYTEGALDGESSAGANDAFVMKYDADGTKLWTRQFGTAKDDRSDGVTTDSDRNVYVSGSTQGSLDGQTSAYEGTPGITMYDIFVTKLVNNSTYIPPPYSSITDPSDGATLTGIIYNVKGTSWGGAGLVEVSTDGGSTWNAASDSPLFDNWSTWSYDWDIAGDGTYYLQSRASNKSGYVETAPQEISVQVSINHRPLSVDSSPPGSGWFTFSPTHPGNIYDEGETVWITAIPSAGFAFENWTGDVTGTDNPAMLTMDSDKYVTANFGDIVTPLSSITAPANGATLGGTSYTITGTASDAGSGVSTVEVSTDGGTSWSFANYTSGTWSYDWSFAANGTYNIRSRATDYSSYVETPVAGIYVTVFNKTLTSPEQTVSDWDAWLTGGQCSACHQTPSTFLAAGFFDGPGFCRSCHNAAAAAHERNPMGTREHSLFKSVTSAGCVQPTYGNITSAEWDNRPSAHLMDGDKVVCATCHNIMQKTEDVGRVWEYTTTSDDQTYTMQNGGWSGAGYFVPKVYRDTTLWTGPTYIKDGKAYLVEPSEYSYDETAGTITFGQAQDPGAYVYVTLDYPYLRASTYSNRLCADCHPEATHMGVNCLTCHRAHNTDNLAGVRDVVRTTDLSERPVSFARNTGANSFADGDLTYDGICEVCHTATKYHTRDGSGFTNHSGGVNQAGTDCTVCHSHASGFAR